jgi:hypothetical protein
LSLIEAPATGLPYSVSNVVPRETDVSGAVSFLSLSKSSDFSASTILPSLSTRKNMQRTGYVDKIKAARFDITEEAEKLQSFYLEAIRNI